VVSDCLTRSSYPYMLSSNQVLNQGRYRIIDQFGSYEAGRLYEAYDTVSNTKVVLRESAGQLGKVATAAQIENFKASFAADAKRLTNVEHPSILKVTDYFSEIDRQYLVMESCEGSDLASLVSGEEKAPSMSDILKWGDQLLDGLHYLHTQSPAIVHQAVSPRNARLSSNFKVKLLVSGESQESEALDSEAATDDSDLAYKALEQLWLGLDSASRKMIANSFGEKSEEILRQALDARTDIYSVGATLYFLLTKTEPTDSLARYLEILDGSDDPLQHPHEIDSSIPEDLSKLLMKSLELKREERFSSAAEMRAEFAKIKVPVGRIAEAINNTPVSAPEPTAMDKELEEERLSVEKQRMELEAEQRRLEEEQAKIEKRKLELEAEKKRQTELLEAKRVEEEKRKAEQLELEKLEAAKKAAAEKVKAQQAAEKAAAEKAAAEKAAAEKAAAEKAAAEKAAAEKAAAEKAAAEKAAAEKAAAEKAAAEKAAAEKAAAEKAAAEKAAAEKVRLEAERASLQKQKAELARKEAQIAEARKASSAAQAEVEKLQRDLAKENLLDLPREKTLAEPEIAGDVITLDVEGTTRSNAISDDTTFDLYSNEVPSKSFITRPPVLAGLAVVVIALVVGVWMLAGAGGSTKPSPAATLQAPPATEEKQPVQSETQAPDQSNAAFTSQTDPQQTAVTPGTETKVEHDAAKVKKQPTPQAKPTTEKKKNVTVDDLINDN